jgi:hypothetical protein
VSDSSGRKSFTVAGVLILPPTPRRSAQVVGGPRPGQLAGQGRHSLETEPRLQSLHTQSMSSK